MGGKAAAGDVAGGAGRVEVFDAFEAGMAAQPLLALAQGHVVGVDLGDVVEALAGECAEHVGDALLVLADDAQSGVAQQLVVVEEAAGDGVLDGHDAQVGGAAAHAGEEVGERLVLDHLHLRGRRAQKLVGGGVVETSGHALYGNTQAHSALRFSCTSTRFPKHSGG